MVAIQTMEYYLALKRKMLSSPEKTWKKRDCVLLSERSQCEKTTDCVILALGHSGKGKLRRQQKDQWLVGVMEERGKQAEHTEFLEQ